MYALALAIICTTGFLGKRQITVHTYRLLWVELD
jgi:hypothetical protein